MWQQDGKRRSSPRTFCHRSHSDRAAIFFNKLFADPEAETGSNRALGRKEGIEDLICRSRPHAVPTVSYCDPDASSTTVGVNGSRGTQNDPTFLANCVQAVREQVRQHLPHLAPAPLQVNLVYGGERCGVRFWTEKIVRGQR